MHRYSVNSAEVVVKKLVHYPRDEESKVYKKRWLMLAIYALCAVADAVHWLQYSVVSRIVEKFYGVSPLIVDWTALIFHATFLIFIFPALMMIESMGLKKVLIIGDLLMIAGSYMKVFSSSRSYFYVGFAGQCLLGIAQVFILSIPSHVAGLWFPANELSTACSLGVMGSQIGFAIGFGVPPLVIPQPDDLEETKTGFLRLYISFAVLPTVLLPLLVFVYKSVPPKPPNPIRIAPELEAEEKFLPTFKQLLWNKNYNLLVASYSLNVATFYCMSTLLGQLVTSYFPNGETIAGFVGFLFILFGIFSSFFCGWFMDKTHKFKLLAVALYFFSIVALSLFWLALLFKLLYLLIISGVLLGLFLPCYVIVAIEFSAQLTYPIVESISASILLAFGELMSIALIFFCAMLLETYGEISVMCATIGTMVVGFMVTLMTSDKVLKRLDATKPSPPPQSRRSEGSSHLHDQNTSKNIRGE